MHLNLKHLVIYRFLCCNKKVHIILIGNIYILRLIFKSGFWKVRSLKKILYFYLFIIHRCTFRHFLSAFDKMKYLWKAEDKFYLIVDEIENCIMTSYRILQIMQSKRINSCEPCMTSTSMNHPRESVNRS